jgi:hypothetical protein
VQLGDFRDVTDAGMIQMFQERRDKLAIERLLIETELS